MEAFSERLLREHQPAWQAMQQHPFVTDIEQDRLPTVVFNRYLVLVVRLLSGQCLSSHCATRGHNFSAFRVRKKPI